MGNGLNKVLLVGNIGMDPELRYTPGGQAVLRIRMATNESWLDKDGQRKQRTEWHTVIVWGKRAEGLGRILVKGKEVWVEGRLQTRSWEDQQGNKRYATEINASDLGLCGGGAGGGGERREGGAHSGRSEAEGDGGGGGGGGGGDDVFNDDDDIPF